MQYLTRTFEWVIRRRGRQRRQRRRVNGGTWFLCWLPQHTDEDCSLKGRQTGVARFWDWRQETKTDEAEPSAVDTADNELAPVEVYTQTDMVFGLVATEGRRLSDILNSNSTLAIRDTTTTALFDGMEAGSPTYGWTSILTDDIVLAMPPEHVSPRQLRVHRRQHRVRIGTGPFEIHGIAHVLPGTALDPYVLQTRMRFLALTDAAITHAMGPVPWERGARVALVNVHPIRDLREVVTIS
jgi:hypothetical protein